MFVRNTGCISACISNFITVACRVRPDILEPQLKQWRHNINANILWIIRKQIPEPFDKLHHWTQSKTQRNSLNIRWTPRISGSMGDNHLSSWHGEKCDIYYPLRTVSQSVVKLISAITFFHMMLDVSNITTVTWSYTHKFLVLWNVIQNQVSIFVS